MAAGSCWPRWSAWSWNENTPPSAGWASGRRQGSEVEGQRQALLLTLVYLYPVRQRGREEEEMTGLGHQAGRQLPVQKYDLTGLFWDLDVVDAGEEFVVFVMVMDTGTLSRPLGIEPEAQSQGFVAIIQDGAGAGLSIA
jgi:hypothetical protein